jgi:hypothetical protein
MTSPAEFDEAESSRRWTRVLDSAWSILNAHQKTALQAGLIAAKREHFNGEVFRVLSGNFADETVAGGLYATNMGASMADTAATISGAIGSSFIVPRDMAKQARQILEDEFNKSYARQQRISGPK